MLKHIHARRYYKRSLIFTSSLILLFSLLAVIILNINAKKSFHSQLYQTESVRTHDVYERIQNQMNRLISMSSVMSMVDMPVNVSIGDDYQLLNLWKKMIDSHIDANGQIIDDITIVPSTLSQEQNDHIIYVDSFSFFDVYVESNTFWPYRFILQTDFRTPSLDNVIINVSAYHLGKEVFYKTADKHFDYYISPDGFVLLSSEANAIFKNIEDIYPGIIESVKAEKGDQEFQTYEKNYVFVSEANKEGFYVLSVIPKTNYTLQIRSVSMHTLLIGCLLIPIALLTAYILSRKYYQPIKEITDLLQAYIPKEMSNYEDEISFIRQSLIQQIKAEHIPHQNYTDDFSIIQNAQSAVLQYQISSHFLFNTLENIRTLSVEELGVDNEIETSILILNNIIQESIYQKNVFTTLEQELEISKNYLTLMQLRYSDIQINWDIDNSLLSYAVFKFSIQPILENCFSHAFIAACSSPNKITISAFRDNKNCMCIRIEDNGRGMDRETYARINDQLSSIYNDGENAHIGIYNVHKRIATVFGSEFGIKIFPKAQGLIVEIDYPCLSLPPAPTDRL